MTDVDELRAGWFGDLPDDFSKALLAAGRWVKFERGQLVFCSGDAGTDLYGIASGTARMQITMDAQEQKLGHVIGPGFWFGENEFVSNIPRIMEIEVVTDLRVVRVTQRDFQHLARKFPEAWRWIALLAVQHQNIAIGAADDLMISSSENRIVASLLRLSGHRLGHPRAPSIDLIPVTQSELALTANLSRASAGRILRALEKSREISIEYGALKILDAKALAARLN